VRELRKEAIDFEGPRKHGNPIPIPSSEVDFYVNIMGFQLEGQRDPFIVIRVNEVTS
jgi:hypothetical protein